MIIAGIGAALGLSRLGAAAITAVAVLSIAVMVILWSRADAVKDDRAGRQIDDLENRIHTINDAKRRRNDVETLSDDDLLRHINDGVRWSGETAVAD